MASFMVGVASLLVLRSGGIPLTLFAVLGTFLIYWVIDPKLRAVSAEYEHRQAKYLEELERGVRWEQARFRRGGITMDQGLVTVIGMSIAYVASFLGMASGLVRVEETASGRRGDDGGSSGFDRCGVAGDGGLQTTPGMAPLPAEPPIGGAIWTVVIPALLLIGSFLATFLLYKRFSKEEGE